MTEGARTATSYTAAAHQAAVLSFDDPADFAAASRGLIATMPDGRIHDGDRLIWDVGTYDFLRTDDPAPDTVHPSLWRQGKLNNIHGLFEVTDGVWQARGYDLANLTFIAGETGWVLVDVLTTAATARACLDLANRTLGDRPVKAVIYTHSHVDHFGGVLGVTTPEEVARGDVRVLAPEGFLYEAVNENVIAGAAMARRAMYQFGHVLERGPHGQVDAGLGKAVALGPSGLIAPTETIATTGEEKLVDGIRIVFQNTPDAEAPAEMNFFFPDKRLLCMAENCTHTLHNLCPIRGAQTRDSLAWSKYINEALRLWGDDTDVMLATHHWPRFGNDDVRGFLTLQRDVYRWMHDQTMRLANLGQTPAEIAEELTLPACFDQSHVQGYYGTVSHNVKSIYTKYLGWYDGNPAHLNPHPPVPGAERYVEYMGGADEVLRRARQSFDEGDYRWVAQVVDHVVFADPSNIQARELQADALEQMGYQSESATWRNAYLQGAAELRNALPKLSIGRSGRLAHAMTVEQLIDSIGVRLDSQVLDGMDTTVNLVFRDLDERHVLGVANNAIHHHPDQLDANAAATITLTRTALADMLASADGYAALADRGDIEVTGDGSVPLALFGAIIEFRLFPIVEP